MERYLLPILSCPFPSQLNQYVTDLEQYSIEWLDQFNLLTNESDYQRFRKGQFFVLAASAYPDCQWEELKIANDWLSWVFIWDDQCDASELAEQPQLLNTYHKRFLKILNGAELTQQDSSMSRALHDIRQRMLAIGSRKYVYNFVNGIEKYFQGCEQAASNRLQKTIPDIDNYIKLRRLSVGVDSVIELIEFCNHCLLPDFLREHKLLKKLKIITNDIISWDNDIFSSHREKLNGDTHNLVFVLHYQYKLSWEEAIRRAVKMRDQQMQSFIYLSESLPSFGERIDADLAKYILGLQAWIRGSLDWYSRTSRYQSTEILTKIAC